MNTDKKMALVEVETLALMAYLDSRNLRADIGLSALISALITVSTMLELPIPAVMDAIKEARTMGDELLSSKDKTLH